MDSRGPQKSRALIVEDDAAMRTMLAYAMKDLGFEVREAGHLSDAVSLATEQQSDIVLLDLNFGPGPTGLDLVPQILEAAPYCAILILSLFRSPQMASYGTVNLPPSVSFLSKRDVTSVEVLSGAVVAAMDQAAMRGRKSTGAHQISQSQAEVLRMMAEGLSNEAIRRQRGCSIRAVERVMTRLFASLGLDPDDLSNMRAQAVRMYLESDIVVR